MSLLERVKRAQNESNNLLNDNLYLQLRTRIQEIISPDKIVELNQISSGRAKSEVLRACEHVFRDPEWAILDKSILCELREQIIDSLFGFGPLENLLIDDGVTEIMVNGFKTIYYERDGKLFRSDMSFANEEQLRVLIDRILGPMGRRVDESYPMANARLATGHRVHVVIPPISLCGPIITIRKFSKKVLHLDDLVERGSLSKQESIFLTWAVQLKKNIAVSGGTGSGKTTLLNALSCEIPFNERIITIEDSAELRFFEHPHVVSLEARPVNTEGKGQVSIRDLVINALRMRPDRIVVGECRGAEALDMLQAMSTGHDGSLTTLHANSAEEVVQRLTTMVRYTADLPVDTVEHNIASAVDLIVQIARAPNGSRYLSQLCNLFYSNKQRCCKLEKLYERGPFQNVGKWLCFPNWLEEVSQYGYASQQEFDAWKRNCLLHEGIG